MASHERPRVDNPQDRAPWSPSSRKHGTSSNPPSSSEEDPCKIWRPMNFYKSRIDLLSASHAHKRRSLFPHAPQRIEVPKTHRGGARNLGKPLNTLIPYLAFCSCTFWKETFTCVCMGIHNELGISPVLVHLVI